MDIQIEISGAACVLLALLCLAVPMDWLLAAMIAAAIHELCHISAVCLLGGRIYSLRVGIFGTVMDASEIDDVRQLICVLAGPAGSLLLVLFSGFFPRTAICGFIQGLFNLLPVYPLDGGRALACVLRLLVPRDKWESMFFVIQTGILMLLTTVSVCLIVAGHFAVFSVFYVIAILLRIVTGKFSCKEGRMAVQ